MPVSPKYQDAETIQRILHQSRTVAIVGLSANALRASNFVGFYADRHGYEVIPVNPREDEIMGFKCYPTLADIPGAVDVGDACRDPSAAIDIARQAVAIQAGALWLQFGVISDEAAEIAKAGGLDVVMDRCFKIEHARYIGRMHWLGFNTGVITGRRPGHLL